MAIARVPALTEKPQQQVVRQGMFVEVELRGEIKTSLLSSVRLAGRPGSQLCSEAQASQLQPTNTILIFPPVASLSFLIMNTYCSTYSYSSDKVAACHVNVSGRYEISQISY